MNGDSRKVLVAGIGRGGTTAVTSMLYHAGFNVSGEADPDKFFEDESLRRLLLTGEFGQLQGELDRRVEKYGRVAWKDPKLFRDAGMELVRQLPSDWIIIIVFRDPVAIVSRRVISDKVEFSQIMPKVVRLIRKLYDFGAEIAGLGRQVIYVSYEKIMTEPVESVLRICADLKLDVDQERAANIAMRMQSDKVAYLADPVSRPEAVGLG
jgi:hypothetical protein